MKTSVVLDFEKLVELYYQRVFSFAARLCGGLEQALELTQHTFCQALSHKSYLGEKQRAKSWLFTLLFREFLKQRGKDRETTSPCGPSRPGSTLVLNAMAKMPKGLRDPLVLFYAKDFSFSQIADYLGISLDTVLTLLAKGRKELRFALAPPGTRSYRFPTYLPTRVRRAETWPMAA
jgi:RNA polymerase sigma-70 factor (ECF subfamily)